MSAFHVCFPGQSLGGEEHEEVKWTQTFRLMAYECFHVCFPGRSLGGEAEDNQERRSCVKSRR